MPRHFVSDLDLSKEEQQQVLDLAARMKSGPGAYTRFLNNQMLAMIFLKNSTRTRVSFEAAMVQLGGHALFLSSRDIQIGRGEPIADTARVLSRFVSAIMLRTFAHADVRELAEFATVPVINGLDDLLHPCQALADLLTIREHLGTLAGKQLAYVGDGNNVAHSLMLAGARSGLNVRVIAPKGYQPKAEILAQAREAAQETGAHIEVTDELNAVFGADAIYTDVWASMGQEEQAKKRMADFKGFQVDRALMAKAHEGAIFLHCLPAHRGEEVAADVIDGPQSRVWDQAENRLHTQKALLAFLLGVA